jgi:hypothetical protein
MTPPVTLVHLRLPTYIHRLPQAAVKRVLSDSEEVVAQDVGPLLKAVVATNKFEREMAALFGGKRLKEEEDDDSLQVCGLVTLSFAKPLCKGVACCGSQ